MISFLTPFSAFFSSKSVLIIFCIFRKLMSRLTIARFGCLSRFVKGSFKRILGTGCLKVVL